MVDSLRRENDEYEEPPQKARKDLHWALRHLGYGGLMALPIPFINWVWLIMGVRQAYQAGWPRGFLAMTIQLATAYVGRAIIGFILSVVLS